MIEYKTIIDKNGDLIDRCVLFIDNIPQYFNIKENYIIVERYDGSYIKPKLVNGEWIETATDEEIKEYYNKLRMDFTLQ